MSPRLLAPCGSISCSVRWLAKHPGALAPGGLTPHWLLGFAILVAGSYSCYHRLHFFSLFVVWCVPCVLWFDVGSFVMCFPPPPYQRVLCLTLFACRALVEPAPPPLVAGYLSENW